MAGISPFKHLKCINWCLILIAVRISSVMLLYKLQNAMEKVVFRTNDSLKGLSYGYELDCDGKFSHVKLLIKEKYSHTIITERCRFCCFKWHHFAWISLQQILARTTPPPPPMRWTDRQDDFYTERKKKRILTSVVIWIKRCITCVNESGSVWNVNYSYMHTLWYISLQRDHVFVTC